MTFFSKITILVLLAVSSASVWAADGEGYKGEVVGFGGLQHFPGVTKASLGGAVGATFAHNSVLFAETTYAPIGEGVKLLNWVAGVDIGFSTRVDRLVPYFTAFGGLGQWSGNGARAENNATFGAGFGARYFLGPRWGFRPEFRWQRYQEAAGGVNSYSFAAGLFYRFGSR